MHGQRPRLLWPVHDGRSGPLAESALSEVAAACGLSRERYFQALETEGPNILKRLPGVRKALQ
jgi:hypothetical protein